MSTDAKTTPAPRDLSARTARALLAIIVLAGAGLRLVRPGYHILGVDEGHSLLLARHSVGEILRAEPQALDDRSPPLYYAALSAWRGLVGEDIGRLRLLGILLGSLAVWAIYWLARQWFCRKVALTAAALAAVNPWLIFFAQELRAYPMFLLLCVLHVTGVVKWARCLTPFRPRKPATTQGEPGEKVSDTFSQGPANWIALAIVAGAAAGLTHYQMLFVVAAETLWMMVLPPRRFANGNGWKMRLAWVGMLAGMAALASWWIPGLRAQLAARDVASRYVATWTLQALGAPVVMLGGTALVRPYSPKWALAAAAAATAAGGLMTLLCGLAAWWKRAAGVGGGAGSWRLWGLLWLLTPVAMLLAISLLVSGTFSDRYLVCIAPPLLILLAAGLWRMPRWAGAVAAALLLALAAAGQLSYHLCYEKTAIRPILAELADPRQADRALVVYPGQYQKVLTFYVDPRRSGWTRYLRFTVRRNDGGPLLLGRWDYAAGYEPQAHRELVPVPRALGDRGGVDVLILYGPTLDNLRGADLDVLDAELLAAGFIRDRAASGPLPLPPVHHQDSVLWLRYERMGS